MVERASKSLDESRSVSVSPTLLLMHQDLQRLKEKPIASCKIGRIRYELRHGGGSLWIIAQTGSGARFAFCVAYLPGQPSKLEEAQKQEDGRSWRIRLRGVVGHYLVEIRFPSEQSPVLQWSTALRPSSELALDAWPRDVLPLDERSDPTRTQGVVHASQQGPHGNLLYASVTQPHPATLLYIQDYGRLARYFGETYTSPDARIGGAWPELGFALPTAPDKPLSQDCEYTISSAYLTIVDAVPDDDVALSRRLLDLYAQIYLAMERPRAAYRNWTRRAGETLAHLTHSPLCGVDIDGMRYLRAYAGTDDRPPESMVQLAVLVPLVEYSRSRRLTIPLCAMLKRNLATFFDEKIGSIVRWLPALGDLLQGQEEHMKPNLMDSWYLWHTYMNLARAASLGDAEARTLLLQSLEHGIRVAHRFEYRWPVFYDMQTLEVIKAESKPGEGGEHDVGALYAHVMLLAHELTGEQRYLNEAIEAARRLRGLGLDLGYQANNVSFGAGAMFRLWKQTKDEQFQALSEICWANIIRNLWLWQCQYGNARHYATFMGLPPLQDAKYIALYEELEVLAAIHEYLRLAGDEAPPALRVLLPEYCKYVIDRAWYHYPSELPADAIAGEPNSGKLNRDLSVPLEDLYDGWQKAGQVGQEVYGAAAPLIIATRHCHRVSGAGFTLHCNYPIADLRMRRTRGGGEVTFRHLGDRRCRCHVRVVADSINPLPQVRLRLRTGRTWRERTGELSELGYLDFELPGNAQVKLAWQNGSGRNGAAEHFAMKRTGSNLQRRIPGSVQNENQNKRQRLGMPRH